MRARLGLAIGAASLVVAFAAALIGPVQAVETVLPCPEIIGPIEIEYPSAAGNVVFQHKVHLNDMEISCDQCHHETLAGRLEMPHLEYFEDFWIRCATCHRGTDSPTCPEACSNCHHNPPTSIADETLSSKVVIHQSCWQCHPVGAGAEASQGCGFCHQSDSEGRE